MEKQVATVLLAFAGMLAVLLVAPVAESDPLEPPWIHELVQQGQSVEVQIGHTYLDVGYEGPGPGHEELTLVRYSEDDGSLRIVFERESFTRETDGVQCGDWTCVEPDEDGCGEAPENCFDCDEDDAVECPNWVPCISNGCQSIEVDDCVSAGLQTYALFSWYDGEYFNCDWTQRVEIDVADVGQDCPAYEDDFECVDLPDRASENSGCSMVPARAAGSMTALMLLIGLGAFWVSRVAGRRR